MASKPRHPEKEKESDEKAPSEYDETFSSFEDEPEQSPTLLEPKRTPVLQAVPEKQAAARTARTADPSLAGNQKQKDASIKDTAAPNVTGQRSATAATEVRLDDSDVSMADVNTIRIAQNVERMVETFSAQTPEMSNIPIFQGAADKRSVREFLVQIETYAQHKSEEYQIKLALRCMVPMLASTLQINCKIGTMWALQLALEDLTRKRAEYLDIYEDIVELGTQMGESEEKFANFHQRMMIESKRNLLSQDQLLQIMFLTAIPVDIRRALLKRAPWNDIGAMTDALIKVKPFGPKVGVNVVNSRAQEDSSSDSESRVDVDAIHRRRSSRPRSRSRGRDRRSHSRERRNRNGFDGKCYHCGKVGHRRSECRSKPRDNKSGDSSKREVMAMTARTAREAVQLAVRSEPEPKGEDTRLARKCTTYGNVDGFPATLLFDSGADINVMSQEKWKEIARERELKPHQEHVDVANDSKMDLIGTAKVVVGMGITPKP